MSTNVASKADRVAYAKQEIDRRYDTVRLVDSSSAIDMAKSGVAPRGKLYATRRMLDELELHAARGKIPYEMLKAFELAPVARIGNYMDIKADVIRASEAACSEKKRTRDPISQEDIGLVVEAIGQVKHGKRVTVLSEDEHIYATLSHMLTDGYKEFSPLIDILRLRELLA